MAVARLNVKLGGALGRLVGKESVEVEMDLPAGREEVISALAEQVPELSRLLGTGEAVRSLAAVTVGGVVLREGQEVGPGDSVSVFMAFAGG